MDKLSGSGEKQLVSVLAEIQKQLVLMNHNIQLLTKAVIDQGAVVKQPARPPQGGRS